MTLTFAVKLKRTYLAFERWTVDIEMKAILGNLPIVSIVFQNKNGKNLIIGRALLIMPLPVGFLK